VRRLVSVNCESFRFPLAVDFEETKSSLDFAQVERGSGLWDFLFRQERPLSLCDMPRPRNERQALEDERDVELPTQLVKYRRDLAATTARGQDAGASFIEWQIRSAEKRMADVCARLAAIEEATMPPEGQ